MKKRIIFTILAMNILILAGCTSAESEKYDIHGTYVMVINGEEGTSLPPTLKLDSENNTFVFSYNPLSSYLSAGTYTVEDSILTASTNDGKYQYLFEIIDETTLKFIEEGSSEIITEPDFSPSVEDGTEFQLQ